MKLHLLGGARLFGALAGFFGPFFGALFLGCLLGGFLGGFLHGFLSGLLGGFLGCFLRHNNSPESRGFRNETQAIMVRSTVMVRLQSR